MWRCKATQSDDDAKALRPSQGSLGYEPPAGDVSPYSSSVPAVEDSHGDYDDEEDDSEDIETTSRQIQHYDSEDPAMLTDEGNGSSMLLPEAYAAGYHSESSQTEARRLPPANRHPFNAAQSSDEAATRFAMRPRRGVNARRGNNSLLQTPLLDVPEKPLTTSRRQLKGSARAGPSSYPYCRMPLPSCTLAPSHPPAGERESPKLTARAEPSAQPPHAIARSSSTGSSTIASTCFSLPPLRSGSATRDTTVQRCTSYCCAVSLELEAIFEPLQVRQGAGCMALAVK